MRKILLIMSFLQPVLILVGCTSTVSIRVEEIPEHADVKLVELACPSSVVGVVLSDSTQLLRVSVTPYGADTTRTAQLTTVDFAEEGGSVDLNGETVTGRTAEGQLFTGQFVDLKYIMVKETDIARKFVTPTDLSCDLREVKEGPLKRLERGTSPCWDVIAFDKNGGRYDSATNTIRGTSRNGTAVVVPRDEVVYVAYNHIAPFKYAKIGLSAAVLLAMCNGIFHFVHP